MEPQAWYCGWCGFGPLSFVNDIACCVCYRPRDGYCRFEGIRLDTRSHHSAGPNSQYEDPGSHSVSNVDTESRSTRESSVNQSPANSESPKHSRIGLGTDSVTLGLAPNDLIPSAVHSSWEQKFASPDDPVARKAPGVNLIQDNVLQLDTIDKQSPLNDYFSVNSDDPWNQEWVVYAARTLLPGESSYSLETGEPATTSRRRPYDPRRRAEVAFTRNNGGACERCRRRHRACPHRLQELAEAIEGDGTPSQQVMEGDVTRRAVDIVRSNVAAGTGSSTQYGGATHPELSAGSIRSATTFPREPPQRPHGHRTTRAGPSGPSALAPSRRPPASLPPLALDDESGVRRGRPRGRVGVNSRGSQPARRSARHGQGINVISGSSDSSRQSNYALIRETSRDLAPSTPVEETYSFGGTQGLTDELSYMYDGASLRSSPPLPYVQEQSFSYEQMFTIQAQTFDTEPNQRSSLPHGFPPWPEGGYGNSGGTQARFSNIFDSPRSSSRNHLQRIPTRDVDESSFPFFSPSETQFWPSHQADFGQVNIDELAVGSTLLIRDSSLPQTPLNEELMSVPEDPQASSNSSDDLGWQIEDGSLLGVDPLEQIFDSALLDELLVLPEQRGHYGATQLPPAMDAHQQPAGLHEWNNIDSAADLAWDNFYYGGADSSINPLLGDYATYLNNPIFTDAQESTSGSNSNPILTPSDETG